MKEEFLNVFYQHFIKMLVDCLKRKNDPNYNKTAPKENGKEEIAKSDGESKETTKEEEKAGGEEPPKGEEKEKEKEENQATTESASEKDKEAPKEGETTKTEEPPREGGVPKEGETPKEEKGKEEGEGEKEKGKDSEELGMGGEHRYGKADLSAGFVQNNVCELLSYCIRHHGYRIKYFLLGGNAVQKVLKLLNHKDAFLVLGMLSYPSSLPPPLFKPPSSLLHFNGTFSYPLFSRHKVF